LRQELQDADVSLLSYCIEMQSIFGPRVR
jgi:hypothetical protein